MKLTITCSSVGQIDIKSDPYSDSHTLEIDLFGVEDSESIVSAIIEDRNTHIVIEELLKLPDSDLTDLASELQGRGLIPEAGDPNSNLEAELEEAKDKILELEQKIQTMF